MRSMSLALAALILSACTVVANPAPRAALYAPVSPLVTPLDDPIPAAGGKILAGPIFNPGNGHLYYLLKPDTWTHSEEVAVTLGGHLATVRNAEEQKWMVATFGPEKDFSSHAFWIGLHQSPSGEYVWASGDHSPYRNWESTEPNSSGSPDGMYTFIGRYADGSWNDTNDKNEGANDGTPWSDFGPMPRGLVEIAPAGVQKVEQ